LTGVSESTRSKILSQPVAPQILEGYINHGISPAEVERLIDQRYDIENVYRLSLDTSGNFRLDEGQAGYRLQQQLGRPLRRPTGLERGIDIVEDDTRGRLYDIIGSEISDSTPVRIDAFKASLRAKLTNPAKSNVYIALYLGNVTDAGLRDKLETAVLEVLDQVTSVQARRFVEVR